MSAPVLNKVPGPQIDSTAAERSQPQRLAGAPLGGLALGAALLGSFLIHGAFLGTVLIASPRPNPAEQVESVTVELVPEAAVEPEKPPPPEKPLPEPEKKAEKKPEPRLVIPDFTQMLAAQQAVESPPKPISKKQPSDSPKQPPAASPAPGASQKPPQQSPQEPPQQPPQENPAQQPEQSADTTPPPVTETSPQDAVAAAARLADLMHLPELAALGVFGGAPSDTKAKLSAAEIAAFREEIRKCWTAPSDIPAGQNPKVFIRIAFKSDGNFSAQPEILGGSATMQALSVIKTARQALGECQPYRSLPVGKYKEWKVLDLEFTARDVAGIKATAETKTPPKP